MINSVSLVGNLVRDVDLRFTPSGKAVAKITIAVDRENVKDKTDFPPINVWGKSAENCAQYLAKGSKIAVSGSLTTNSYVKTDGTKVYTTEVLAHRVEFLNTKTGKVESHEEDFADKSLFEDYQNIEDDDSIPF